MNAVNPYYNLLSLPYLGREYNDSKERETLPLEGNETASYIPSLFFIVQKDVPCAESVQALFNRIAPTLTFNNDLILIRALEMDIKNHVENRLQLLYQQLLMVYKTNIEFTYAGAKSQAGLKDKNVSSIVLQEAHCATLPCLLFIKENKTHIFGAGSSFYNAQNMTVKLPIEVNNVDSWIDKSGNNLRKKALSLINKVSFAQIDPNQGFQIFVEQFKERLNAFDASHLEQRHPLEKLACRFYAEVVTSYEKHLQKDRTIFLKTLLFERKSKAPLDDAFLLKIQMRMHTLFIHEMKIQEYQDRSLAAKPLYDTQSIYAKICLASPEMITRCFQYFQETDREILKADWKAVVLITPKKIRGLSTSLTGIVRDAFGLILKTYPDQHTVRNLGAIIKTILFRTSFSINPDIFSFYSESSHTNITTRSSKKIEIPNPRDQIPTISNLTFAQRNYVNSFLNSAEICALLDSYYKTTHRSLIMKDRINVAHITASKIGALSQPLQDIVNKCLKIALKNPQKMGIIIGQLLDQAAPSSS